MDFEGEDAGSAPRRRMFVSQRLNISVATWGNERCPPIILLHGGRDQCRSWDNFAKSLSGTHFVLAPDLRGHGRSDWVSDGVYDVNDMVFDVWAMLQHHGIQSCVIVGHSLGGNVALRLAGIRPELVRALVVIEGLGASPTIVASQQDVSVWQRMQEWFAERQKVQTREQRSYADFDSAVSRFQELHPALPPEVVHELVKHNTSRRDDGRYVFRHDPYAILTPPVDLTWPEKHALWSHISAPVLLVYGAKSWASNPEQDGRTQHFQNCRTVVISDAGHWVHLEQPAAFQQAFDEFAATL
ncbi:alpha/beta fold hydrolase [Burkholderia multivorans]|uniref:alpha/beta fold hydrolase n=1 Tax=Burkholderia multivorans TaxID=87883 RepID=UPI001C21C883|nr:alpha/beta hydrolase [Burkholderia multivorans]MBU9477660.1 alpha/beta hydrolase [Burkholderia multivorans]